MRSLHGPKRVCGIALLAALSAAVFLPGLAKEGYVLTFTNGLAVYLTGDTGLMSDMSMLRRFYHPHLTVVNVDGVNVMGAEEGAFAMTTLVRPRPVIASHAEQAVTTNGRVSPNTRTARFAALLGDMPVYVPLSGTTMQFDGNANCVTGCTSASR